MQEFKENISTSINQISTFTLLEKKVKELEEENFLYKKDVLFFF